jgi:hypothetical protein
MLSFCSSSPSEVSISVPVSFFRRVVVRFCSYKYPSQANLQQQALWRNGSAFDSRSKGYPFKSGQGHVYLFAVLSFMTPEDAVIRNEARPSSLVSFPSSGVHRLFRTSLTSFVFHHLFLEHPHSSDKLLAHTSHAASYPHTPAAF